MMRQPIGRLLFCPHWLVCLELGSVILIYLKRTIPRDVVSSKMPWLYTLLNRKYFIDEIYDADHCKTASRFRLDPRTV